MKTRLRRVPARFLIAAIGFAGLAGSALAVNSTPQPVVVTNSTTQAIPTTVSNTPNVTVSNTPNVNVANTPTVNVGSIASSATISSVDTTARNIVRLVQNPSFQDSFFRSLDGLSGGQYNVPTGQRLVVTFGTVQVSGPSGFTPTVTLSIYQQVSNSAIQPFIYLPLQKVPSAQGDAYVATLPGPIYADQNFPLLVGIAGGATGWNAFLQGYLVDCGSGCTQ